MDVDMAGSSSGLPAGGKRAAKELYMCTSWEELEGRLNQLQADASLTVFKAGHISVHETLKNLNEMCLAGVLADIRKDEEQAYLNYNRYLTSYIYLSQMEEFRNHPDMVKVEENVSHMVKVVDGLKKSLRERYEQSKAGKTKEDFLQIMKEHESSLDRELEVSRELKMATEELGSLRMVKLLLQEDAGRAVHRLPAVVDQEDGVPEQLKCPVCFEIYQERVFQCGNGHSMCSSCFENGGAKLKECPECRVNIQGVLVRNRALEGLVSTWKVDCPFKDKGCKHKLLCRDMTAHVEHCVWGRSEEERQLSKVDHDIKEKEERLKRLQEKYQTSKANRMKTTIEWRKMDSCFSGDDVHGISELRRKLAKMEHELLQDARMNSS